MFPASELETFWNGVEASGDPRLIGHPMTLVPNWKRLFHPLFIHGDGGEFTERDSIMIYCWGSLLTEGSSDDCSLMLATFPKSCTIKAGSKDDPDTWRDILKWIAWSFNALFHNKHPAVDPWGQPFAADSFFSSMAGKPINESGFRAAVWALEGDQEYFANVLGLNHWSCHKPCWDCNTDKTVPALHFKNLLPGRQQWVVKTMQEAIDSLDSDHGFFEIIGVTSKTVGQDAMHILFCKGVLAYFMGAVLHLWCFPNFGRRARPPAEVLADVFKEVQLIYVQRGITCRITNLKISMFTAEDKPWANVPFLNLKGAECKHLLKPLAIIAARRATESELHARIAAAFAAIDKVVDIMDAAGTFLTPVEHNAMMTSALTFNGNYQWLHDWAQAQGTYLFHIVIKFHMFHHLVLAAKFLNPKRFWCFKGEDYVGRIAALARSVAMGVRSTRLSQKIADKYRHWFHFRLTRGDF